VLTSDTGGAKIRNPKHETNLKSQFPNVQNNSDLK
jgi:hypothetical protein